MNGPTKFVDWLLEMGYLDKEDISTDGVEIARDMNKVKEIAPKFYNMLMCMCDCSERVGNNEETSKYKYLSTLDCFAILKEKCTEEYLDILEEEMRWYEEDATDEDIGECGENLSNFLRYVYGSDDYWLRGLLED